MKAYYDVVIIGAGPGGLAAAKGAKEAGAASVLLLERDSKAGGILNQCVHDGFGLIRYKKMLTGPEYALRAEQEAVRDGITLCSGSMVTRLTADRTVTAVTREGLLTVQAGAVVLATGCRERTRGAIAIPGSRPAGIYTAGATQNLINTKNLMVGKRVVILGSGDIGLIMARRLTLEGAQVLCVAEMRDTPGGLERNVSQCLYDFHIPLYLHTTVTKIVGRKRLEGVELTDLSNGSCRFLSCDTLLLSVGLIPENELAAMAGVSLDTVSNGTKTDAYLQTDISGIFSCGNCRKVMDLADFVSVQGLSAGRNAARWVQGLPLEPMPPESAPVMAKGLPKPGAVTCVLCPKGCSVTLSPDGTVTGHQCPRGEEYAKQEEVSPKRVLTGTLLRTDGTLLPVKTAQPVPRDLLLSCAETLRRLNYPSRSVQCGEVLLPDPFALGIALIATATVL